MFANVFLQQEPSEPVKQDIKGRARRGSPPRRPLRPKKGPTAARFPPGPGCCGEKPWPGAPTPPPHPRAKPRRGPTGVGGACGGVTDEGSGVPSLAVPPATRRRSWVQMDPGRGDNGDKATHDARPPTQQGRASAPAWRRAGGAQRRACSVGYKRAGWDTSMRGGIRARGVGYERAGWDTSLRGMQASVWGGIRACRVGYECAGWDTSVQGTEASVRGGIRACGVGYECAGCGGKRPGQRFLGGTE